jgi:chromosomal replication initiation ATPase DnaA
MIAGLMGARIKDLLDLPRQIRKGDFVLALSEGLERPERTADSYVVTPALRDAFDTALDIVGNALEQGRSRAAYLHGSFGSGKSHFMRRSA